MFGLMTREYRGMNFMQSSPSWKANSPSARQNILCPSWNPKVRCLPQLQATAMILGRSAIFYDMKQRRLATLYWRFGTAYRSHYQGKEVQDPGLLYLEYGTDELSRKVGKGLAVDAASYRRKAQTSVHYFFTISRPPWIHTTLRQNIYWKIHVQYITSMWGYSSIWSFVHIF
jgi:hypothetical protein